MTKNCAKCSNAISGIDFVVCRGYCGAAFHMNACSGVTLALQSYFAANRNNLFWMCDQCAELFENSHFRVLSRQADETSRLCTLTTAITELRSEIKQLHSKPVTQFSPATSLHWPAPEQRRAIKRPREIDFTMRASDSCQIGRKKPLANVVSVPICNKDAGRKFWLYLSKIRPDVTVESVSAMVKANIGTADNISVVKLVPKGRELVSLTFLSFKIGLDQSFKDKALDPSTWPEGLLFREFVDYGSQKFQVSPKYKRSTTPLLPPETVSSPIAPIRDLSQFTPARDATV
ncbi:uncharacterized protein LOC129774529 [Toxorhynchites rutilus septentrionalis]|uniref:uncharacterized protein LOC129774529 n=1 Tax=Toxorhynchites rutilus septentrionalis TaxID=329112 RepID=UPI002478A9E7|nr:uncharacterized protein LOC129774529 [Toxorhynchites rutilus septentrionalis]